MHKIGLLVNPIAGMGGSVGLKGTDGLAEEAARRGAFPRAPLRAEAALQALRPLREDLSVLCAAGAMGESEALAQGFSVQTVYAPEPSTTSRDTFEAAKAIEAAGAELLLFAGGDGTARDLVSAGVTIPCVGIPAGVKIHSPVYAVRPEAAGELACRFLKGERRRTKQVEVVDIDEAAWRNDQVSTCLYGYLTVPDDRSLLQHGKAASPASEAAQHNSIASEMAKRLKPGCYYLIGPGTTTKGTSCGGSGRKKPISCSPPPADRVSCSGGATSRSVRPSSRPSAKTACSSSRRRKSCSTCRGVPCSWTRAIPKPTQPFPVT